ncbi:MAG TPA: aldehyde dehydrogenase family protein, partial [Candidatus Sulfotelmatobacter sp.]
MKSLLNYIDGQFVTGKREFADVNPADGSVIAQVAEADQGLVDDAVRAARKALGREWGGWTIPQRAARLRQVADGIEARFDRFVAAEVADTGKPAAVASRLDVPRAAANFRVFADMITTAGLESFQTESPNGKNALN